MNRPAETSGLLAKVVRGAHLSGFRWGGAIDAAGFFEDGSEPAERPEAGPAVSGLCAMPNGSDVAQSGALPSDAGISDLGSGNPFARSGDEPGEPEKSASDTDSPRLVAQEHEDAGIAVPRFAAAKERTGAGTPASNDSESTGGESSVRLNFPAGDLPAEPREDFPRTLHAGDFQPGHEKRMEKRNEKSGGLKALFREQDPESTSGRGGKHAEKPHQGREQDERGKLLRDEIVASGGNRFQREDPKENSVLAAPAAQDKISRETTGVPVNPALPWNTAPGFYTGRARAVEGITARPVAKSGQFAPPPQALPPDMPARRGGILKIGTINISVKGKTAAERAEAWPEAPAYADHAITDDWEWSCLYGR